MGSKAGHDSSARGPRGEPGAGKRGAWDAIDEALRAIEAELGIALGSEAIVAARCKELAKLLDECGHATAREALLRLTRLLGRRGGQAATPILWLLGLQTRRDVLDAEHLLALLGAPESAVRELAVGLVAGLLRVGRIAQPNAVLAGVAAADERSPLGPEALRDAGTLLEAAPPAGAADDPPLVRWLLSGESREVRRLAARALDARGERPTAAMVCRLFGAEPAQALLPYLEFTAATHTDLVDMGGVPGQPPPMCASLVRAEAALGAPMLRDIVARLGWPRITHGLSVETFALVSVEGSFPFLLPPALASMVGRAMHSTERERKTLVVAHGGALGDDGGAHAPDPAVERFRAYNLVHAQLLDLILEVAPLDEAKVRRVVGMLGRVVADFAALFEGRHEDASRVRATFDALVAPVEKGLEAAAGKPLTPDLVRRVQMFEDPLRLDDVTTLHGLKRYLHQLGLRLAFGLFRGSGEANRTVDLLVTSEHEVLAEARVIKYLELEPTEVEGDARLPFVVSLLAEAFGRQLLHGRDKLPGVIVLGYGNEVQTYVNYRNHPAFLRVDLSPPLRGGMIDLEYFAVSQFELDQHPNLELPAIQRLVRSLELDVQKDGQRLHLRYDKERAFDRSDLIRKVRDVFALLPYLMEVDWVIGDLDYPEQARTEVAVAWSSFFGAWGLLPTHEVLTPDRRKIQVAVEPDPAGARIVAWDGRDRYRDCFTGTPPIDFVERLRALLDQRGLEGVSAGTPWRHGAPGQVLVDECVLRPLRAAIGRGEVVATEGHLAPAPGDLYETVHEAELLAGVLAAGGEALSRAAQAAALARGIERQVRFHTTGSVQGYAVQAATLPVAATPVGLFVLRDAQGIIRAALAAQGGVACRRRATLAEPWRGPELLAPGELARLLRSVRYLDAAGAESWAQPSEVELAAMRERLLAPSPEPLRSIAAEERLMPGTVAAPGRATGTVVFSLQSRKPPELAGSVVVAPTVRPEDTPWLRHAEAMASTGGGALSHVGLIALELGKPAVIIDGTWSARPSGARVLEYTRPCFRETTGSIEGLEVRCRRELREVEEQLEEGDVVSVDSDAGGVLVLGHDPQAIALHEDLHQLEAASALLAITRSEPEILECRGRLLRAVHQLEKLVGRLDRPVLARHAVHELLSPRGLASGIAGRAGRARLLSILLASPTCGAEARHEAERRVDELEARYRGAAAAALLELPRRSTPVEVLWTRLGVVRMREALAGIAVLSAACGLPRHDPPGSERVEAATLDRLRKLDDVMAGDLALAERGQLEPWRLRHLLREGVQLGALGQGGVAARRARKLHAYQAGSDAACLERTRHLSIVEAPFGLELAPLVGSKAASLGEVVSVLGRERVPAWFCVGEAAFRRTLACAVPPAALEQLGLGGAAGCDLGAAITVALEREADSRRAAEVIRRLWLATPWPNGLGDELAAAYRRLGAENGGESFVAVRSSGCEEDTDAAAWAGQFDTFLFVRGDKQVLEHVKLAWAGFWTARAIEHRRAVRGAPAGLGGGVMVQRMVDARVSGVLHTVSAATGQLGDMVINAGLGLGEGVVSGLVEVDHVLVSKASDVDRGELALRYTVGDKREEVVRDVERGVGTRRRETLYHQRLRPALEYVEVLELVREARRLEAAFLRPLDIEFALEGVRLYVLQARPIAVLEAAWAETATRYPLARAPAPEPGREEVQT